MKSSKYTELQYLFTLQKLFKYGQTQPLNFFINGWVCPYSIQTWVETSQHFLEYVFQENEDITKVMSTF